MPISGCPCMRMGSGCVQVETAATAPGRHRRNAYSFPGTSPAPRDFGSNAQTSKCARKTIPIPKNTFYRGFCAWREALPPAFLSTAHKKESKAGGSLAQLLPQPPIPESQKRGHTAQASLRAVRPLCRRGTEPIGNMPSAVAPGARKRPRSPARSAGSAPPPKASQCLEGKRGASQQMAPGQPDRYPKALASSSPGTKASSARKAWEVY